MVQKKKPIKVLDISITNSGNYSVRWKYNPQASAAGAAPPPDEEEKYSLLTILDVQQLIHQKVEQSSFPFFWCCSQPAADFLDDAENMHLWSRFQLMEAFVHAENHAPQQLALSLQATATSGTVAAPKRSSSVPSTSRKRFNNLLNELGGGASPLLPLVQPPSNLDVASVAGAFDPYFEIPAEVGGPVGVHEVQKSGVITGSGLLIFPMPTMGAELNSYALGSGTSATVLLIPVADLIRDPPPPGSVYSLSSLPRGEPMSTEPEFLYEIASAFKEKMPPGESFVALKIIDILPGGAGNNSSANSLGPRASAMREVCAAVRIFGQLELSYRPRKANLGASQSSRSLDSVQVMKRNRASSNSSAGSNASSVLPLGSSPTCRNSKGSFNSFSPPKGSLHSSNHRRGPSNIGGIMKHAVEDADGVATGPLPSSLSKTVKKPPEALGYGVPPDYTETTTSSLLLINVEAVRGLPGETNPLAVVDEPIGTPILVSQTARYGASDDALDSTSGNGTATRKMSSNDSELKLPKDRALNRDGAQSGEPCIKSDLVGQAIICNKLGLVTCVPRIFCIARMDQRLQIVMELLRGGTTVKLLEFLEPKKIPLPLLRGIAFQLLEALSVFRRLGILHNDIQPQNIMFGEHGRTVITDFGASVCLPLQNDGTVESLQGLMQFYDNSRVPATPASPSASSGLGHLNEHARATLMQSLYSFGGSMNDLDAPNPGLNGDTKSMGNLALLNPRLKAVGAAFDGATPSTLPLGRLSYVSPERQNTNFVCSSVDELFASDLWSLGMCLLQLVTVFHPLSDEEDLPEEPSAAPRFSTGFATDLPFVAAPSSPTNHSQNAFSVMRTQKRYPPPSRARSRLASRPGSASGLPKSIPMNVSVSIFGEGVASPLLKTPLTKRREREPDAMALAVALDNFTVPAYIEEFNVDFADLLTLLLSTDPQQRTAAADLLSHPFFSTVDGPLTLSSAMADTAEQIQLLVSAGIATPTTST